mmetsp:Transcript_15605/g.18136  ORF Transcript_15605/g.18136 Transcript_15605/m.18136 type:complete len:94 (-) Transcript_15605:37-318(-)
MLNRIVSTCCKVNAYSSNCGHYRKKFSSSSSPKQNNSSRNKTIAIFSVGLYLGLCLFKDGNRTTTKRQNSGYLADLKENFDRTSGVTPQEDEK